MQTELPQFRNDLHSQLILREGTRLVEVTCPVSGTSFEFFETEYAVACAMDGQKDVDGLAAWSQAQLGFSPEADELEAIVSKLTDLGYLSGSVPAVQDAASAVADAPVELGASGPQADSAAAAHSSNSDVALGSAGGTAPSNSEAAPVAAAVSLGVAGAAGAMSQKSSSVDDVTLGSAGDATDASHASGSAKTSDGAQAASASGVLGSDDMPAAQNQDLSVNLEGHLDFSDGDAGSKDAAPGLSASLSASSAANDSESLTPIEKAQLADTAPVPPAADGDVDSIAARMDTDARALSEPLGSGGLSSADDVGRPVSARSAPRESVNAGAPVVLASPPSEALQAKSLEAPSVTGGTALKEKPVRRPLWAIAIISILAVAGAAYYWFFHHLPSLATSDNLSPSVERAAASRTRKMASIRPIALGVVPAAPPSDTIQATRTDSIEWMVAPGTEVAQGDVLVRFRGYEEARLAQVELQAEVAKINESLEAGVSRRVLASTKKSLEKAERSLTENATSLKELAVMAPKAGAVEPLVEIAESGDTKVQAGQDIVRLASASGLMVSFDLGVAPVGYEENSIGNVAPTADPEMKIACKYAGASDTKVNFACPLDSGLSAGTEVGLYRSK